MISLEETTKDRLSKTSNMNTRDTANLHKLLLLVPNIRVRVVQVVSMEDGLCNGVVGLLKKVDMGGMMFLRFESNSMNHLLD